MKKYIILFFTLFVLSVSSKAQSQISAKYHGEIDLGYSIGVGTFSTDRVNIHTVQGVMVGKYFSAGLGLGLDYYHEIYDKGELMIPIFLDLKGYIPVTDDLSPFVSFDLGYGIGATDGLKGCDGLLWSPAIGIRYKHFKFQLGYASQRISEDGFGFDMNAVQFKIGAIF